MLYKGFDPKGVKSKSVVILFTALMASYLFEVDKFVDHAHLWEYVHLYRFTVQCTATHNCDPIKISHLQFL